MTPLDRPNAVHLLLDPDRWNAQQLKTILSDIPACVASIIVGGTYVHSDRFARVMDACAETAIPVGNILGAGSLDSMLSPRAHFAILPVLLGSRDAKFVTDHIIQAAPTLDRLHLETVPTGYMMFDGGISTSMQFFTQQQPIPRKKPEIVRTLALTASYLGLRVIYLEAGSGAKNRITVTEVGAARMASKLSILVGGGIEDANTCRCLFEAGATGIVLGSIIERKREISWLNTL